MASSPKYLTGDKAAINEFIDKFDTFLFDCDGVLWSGDHVFDRVPETIMMLKARGSSPLTSHPSCAFNSYSSPSGKRTVFVTNNSTKSREDYLQKISNLHIPCEKEDVFGSSYSAAIYISRILKLPPGKNKVFAIGEAGVEKELAAEGIPCLGGTDPNFRRDMTPKDFQALADGTALDPEVGVVLCGLDFHINYLKLSTALHYLRRGAIFLATNTDSTLPMHHSFFMGAGSIMIPLQYASGTKPLELGKPSQAMMDAVEGKFQLDRSKTCMVGDRLNTDIKFGIDGKLGGTLHVLTGVHQKEDWDREDAVAVPAYYADKLSDLAVVA
ncbi:haloacid dehydrogenase (HAD) superfamily protein [Metarhizium robertsii]|uniref:4-nitrophenylphosphatase n=2 Tax=Metarhizium robertsii TaxID=568076 RepID=E9F185_METRA|nr:phosphoglycolate/pyridoxal phosphate phosphatase [Metarhizium robertsii ARSEF 23]EFY98895.2 phosphoglycolate/pyridoxal phosphate phosphatase [Metarhizium robertsii ARSEF 23]EXV03941.1 haloacid dehydrogenase (HAD) superfamily protein [Metarhizium robertsii]